MDWEDRLDEWELELELSAQLDGSDWVTLERAAAETGVSRAALRNWYRTGQIPSRLVDGPHGPQRLVPLAMIAARAEASPRLRHSAERRLADEAQLEILRHRVNQLELRLTAVERRLPPGE
jgi:transposase